MDASSRVLRVRVCSTAVAKVKHHKTFNVSRATARVLSRGHPWILPDAESDDPTDFRPGSQVRVQGPKGQELGWARIEGKGPIAARMWARAGTSAGDEAEEVDARVKAALSSRYALSEKGSARLSVDGESYTEALRLIHGEADRLPGLSLDRLGPLLRVGIWGAVGEALLSRVVDRLQVHLGVFAQSEPQPIIEVRYQPPKAGSGRAAVRWRELPPKTWLSEHFEASGRVNVFERGLAFGVEPGLVEPARPRPGVGLFLDQRENRARMAKRARRGGRWLNLFAHTGAFSVALLAAGADRVVSVDLSAAYLKWLEQNLKLNRNRGVDVTRHDSIRHEGRRYLNALEGAERFSGIVVDPPTAAAAGRHYWSIRKDLEPLLGDCFKRLEPGGVLLVCRNDRFEPSALRSLVETAAARVGVALSKVEIAGPGPDFPRLKGFPEGEPFTGVVAERL